MSWAREGKKHGGLPVVAEQKTCEESDDDHP